MATAADLQAVLGRAVGDVLVLENSNARGRTLASLLLTGARLLETGELETRLRTLEDAFARASAPPLRRIG